MRNQLSIKNLVTLVACLSAVACAKSKSQDLVAPPPVYFEDGATGDGVSQEINPKVDILFVVDNSASMKEEQAKLQKASEQFVDSIGENSLIDYRVGVITVYDSRRCGKPFQRSDFDTQAEFDSKKDQLVPCHPEGQLLPVKATNATLPFIPRAEGAKEVLKATLNVGIIPLKEGGPRYEELYSPLLKALSAEGNRLNGGFIRSDSKIVIVMVTDEDDSSATIAEDEFLYGVDRLVGSHRVELHAVIANDGCERNNYADAPDRLESAVNRMNGSLHKICAGDYGKSLGDIGQNIRKQAVAKEIKLNTRPEAGTLQLFYGKTEMPKGKGWAYNPRTNAVIIKDSMDVKYVAGAKFEVRYVRYAGK